MRKSNSLPLVHDDLDKASLIEAIESNIAFIRSNDKITEFRFGPHHVSRVDYVKGLDWFKSIVESSETMAAATEKIQKSFDFYEVHGTENWGDVFITGYYEPVIKGSKISTEKLNQPLYGSPSDMVVINVSKFAEVFGPDSALANYVNLQRSKVTSWRGRVVNNGPNTPAHIAPYFSRKEIDSDKKISNKKLILAWVDPIDAFFLQIQGSGTIQFENGDEIRLGYASQNGHPYVPIGKYLTEVIPIEEMSMQKIKNHLYSLPKEKMNELLNKNPSYVFFKKNNTAPVTYFGTPANAGRTIATDHRFFQKGTLAFLQFEKPVFENETAIAPKEWQSSSRFVIDQDTGGAIRGGGRLDLFWGRGPLAAQSAGVMRGKGRLYYLVPKAGGIPQTREVISQKPLIKPEENTP